MRLRLFDRIRRLAHPRRSAASRDRPAGKASQGPAERVRRSAR